MKKKKIYTKVLAVTASLLMIAVSFSAISELPHENTNHSDIFQENTYTFDQVSEIENIQEETYIIERQAKYALSRVSVFNAYGEIVTLDQLHSYHPVVQLRVEKYNEEVFFLHIYYEVNQNSQLTVRE